MVNRESRTDVWDRVFEMIEVERQGGKTKNLELILAEAIADTFNRDFVLKLAQILTTVSM